MMFKTVDFGKPKVWSVSPTFSYFSTS
uniref:Uncharacterized protein n=1 Tax=Anguilla anguilla TaxID=7936 RepID=A0A0E9QLQ0_ANGAN